MIKMLIPMFKFEFKLFFRNIVNVFFLLVFPTMMLLIFGNIFGNLPVPEFGGFGTVDITVPAYIGMIICVNGLMNLPLTLCEYREKKVLKRYKATPLRPMTVIMAQIFVNLLMTIIGAMVLILFAKLLFDLNFHGNILVVSLTFLLSTMSVFAIGFVIASVSPNMKAATAIANLVYFPMLFLTGATIPLALMPDLMQRLAHALPITHVVILLRGAWTGLPTTENIINIVILISITVICFGLSVKFFKWE